MLLLLPLVALSAAAEVPPPPCGPGALAEPGDDLRVHLISVAPGWDLTSSMGHTVLLFSGGDLPTPVAWNWGTFEATDQGLVLPFLRGTLPYHVRARPWAEVLEDNAGQGRSITAQRLDLPPGGAEALLATAEQSPSPYRYHWAEANCATRVRDALDGVIGGALHRALDRPVDTTPRIEGSRHLWRWPAVRFAWRFVTSDRMDRPLTAWERTMVPEHLMREVGGASIGRRPLVSEACTVNAGLFGWAPDRADPSPLGTAPGLLVAILALGASRPGAARRPRLAGWVVAAWGLVLASIGTATFGAWAVSDLDGFGPTENWLVAGPQSWLLVWVGWQVARGRPVGRAGVAACVALGALGVGCALLDLLPGTDQANADILLALLPGLLGCVAGIARLRATGG